MGYQEYQSSCYFLFMGSLMIIIPLSLPGMKELPFIRGFFLVIGISFIIVGLINLIRISMSMGISNKSLSSIMEITDSLVKLEKYEKALRYVNKALEFQPLHRKAQDAKELILKKIKEKTVK